MSDSGSDSDEPQWQQQRYTDHEGHPVVREEYILDPDDPAEPEDRVAISVYSTVPLDDDHENLRDYLMGSFGDEEKAPPFEFYSYNPPHAFACVEYHRREIAYRKRLHAAATATETEETNLPPLIPRGSHPTYHSPIGSCVLINSHSYRLGKIYDTKKAAAIGPGPDILCFNRTFSHNLTRADRFNRLEHNPSYQGYRGGGRVELYPEALELEIERVRTQENVDQHVVQGLWGGRLGNESGKVEQVLDEDEGQPRSEPESSVEIQQHLDQQVQEGNLTLDPSFRVSHRDDDAVITVTNKASDNSAIDPDLQYLIYAPFLSHINDFATRLSLLETTARLFTAALATHLPKKKTLNLEFHIPSSTSSDWSSIGPAHTSALERHGNNFPVGALQTVTYADKTTKEWQPAALHRVTPQGRSDDYSSAATALERAFRVFAVVLDKSNFVSEAGVCFYMAEYDGEDEPSFVTFPTAEVLRSAGMDKVARRLGMLAVEEKGRGVKRTIEMVDVPTKG